MNQYKITYKLANNMTTTELRYAADKESAKHEFLTDMQGVADDGFNIDPVSEADIESIVETGICK